MKKTYNVAPGKKIGSWLITDAYIVSKNSEKQYTLGYYVNFEDAVQARKAAEDILIKGTIDHYEKWKKLADNNPEWAEENPIQIKVSKNSYSELEVVFLPVLNDNKG